MNEPSPDEDLQAIFDHQREADRRQAPAFHSVRTRALAAQPASPTWFVAATWRWVAPVAALGLAFAAIVHLPQRPPGASSDALVRQLDAIDAVLQRELAAQSALTAWQSPTDFLLNSHPTELNP